MNIDVEEVAKLMLFQFKKKANGMAGVTIGIIELRRLTNDHFEGTKYPHCEQVEKLLCDSGYLETVSGEETSTSLGTIPSYRLTEKGASYIRTIM